MSSSYDQSSSSLGRNAVYAKGNLSRYSRLIEHFDALTHKLRAAETDSDSQLKSWYAEYLAALETRANLLAAEPTDQENVDCPNWVWANEDVPALPLHTSPFGPPPFVVPGTFSGYAPFTMSEGSNEFPNGAQPLSSTLYDKSLVFGGKLIDTTNSSHWYRDWQFVAQLPPAPAAGEMAYSFYLTCHTSWWANSGMLDGWIQLFFTPLRPPFSGREGICGTEFILEIGWPGNRNVGREGARVFIFGKRTVKAGESAKIALNTHLYAGVNLGEATFGGGYAVPW